MDSEDKVHLNFQQFKEKINQTSDDDFASLLPLFFDPDNYHYIHSLVTEDLVETSSKPKIRFVYYIARRYDAPKIWNFSLVELSKLFNALIPYWSENADIGNNVRSLIEHMIRKASDEDKAALIEVKNQYLYPSGRPRTEMTFIHQKKRNPPNLPIVQGREDNLLIAALEPGDYGEMLIPVLRYASGMSRGMYTEESTMTYCGTFYYFDIGSHYFLHSRRTLVTMNKASAYYHLSGRPPNFVSRLDSAYLESFSTGDYNSLPFDENGNNRDGSGYASQMYASEDHLDQRICQQAFGYYDCIILLRMFGRSRIVTEVLDVRDRKESFDHIYEV